MPITQKRSIAQKLPRRPGKRRPYGKWWRKEPRDLESVHRKYELTSIRQPQLYLPSKFRYSVKKLSSKVQQLLETIIEPDIEGYMGRGRRLDFSNRGQGQVYIFPMTRAAGMGEFMKGFLHLIAPEARVIFLVTPRAREEISWEKKQQNFDQNLMPNLERALNPRREHGRKTVLDPKTTKVNIMDDTGGGGGYDIDGTVSSIALGLTKLNYSRNNIRYNAIGEKLYLILHSVIEQGDRLHWQKEDSGKHLFVNKEDRREHKLSRRFCYDLGIVTAKEYLRRYSQWQTQGKSGKSKRKAERKLTVAKKITPTQKGNATLRDMDIETWEEIPADMRSPDWKVRDVVISNLWQAMDPERRRLSAIEQNAVNYRCVRSLITLAGDSHPKVSKRAQNILRTLLLEKGERQEQWINANPKIKELIRRKLKEVKI